MNPATAAHTLSEDIIAKQAEIIVVQKEAIESYKRSVETHERIHELHHQIIAKLQQQFELLLDGGKDRL